MSTDSLSGTLPSSWSQNELGEVAETQLGKMLNSSKQTGSAVKPYLRNINLQWGRIDLSDVKEMDIFEDELEQFSLKKGDVLICEGGETGRSAVWNLEIEMGFQNAIHRVRPSDKLQPAFVCFQFEWLVKNGYLDENFTGVTIKHFSQQKLRKVKLVIPPPEEQEKIVEILEEQLSRLDAALAAVRTMRQKSERFRRSLLHAAFTGALTGHITSDGTLPEGWQRETIAQVAEVVAGRTPTKFEQRLAGSTIENRNVPFYKVGDMNSAAQYLREARVYFAESESGSFGIEILPAGTVIFPKAGGAIATNKKRVLEVPGAIDLNCMGVSSNGVLLPQLLYWFFESFNLSSIADGSVLPQIGKKKVSSIEICYPESVFEQRKLLEAIEASVSRSDAVDRMSEAIEKKASAFRRSLLHAAFSGDLTKEWREGAHV